MQAAGRIADAAGLALATAGVPQSDGHFTGPLAPLPGNDLANKVDDAPSQEAVPAVSAEDVSGCLLVVYLAST